MSELILKFYIFSFFGCILECVWHYFLTGTVKSRRMLTKIPLCPVYGIGAVLFSACLDSFVKYPQAIFILGAVIATSAELIYYAYFKIRYRLLVWDYRDKIANYAGGICIQYSVVWGILAIIYVYFAEKAADYVILSMSAHLKLVVVTFFGVITAADAIETAKIFKSYSSGDIQKLPDCFWYVEKI